MTGGGKSLILAMPAICIGGITLVVLGPLLTLTEDQLARLGKAIQKYGVVSAHRFNEISPKDLRDKMHRFVFDSSAPMLTAVSR